MLKNGPDRARLRSASERGFTLLELVVGLALAGVALLAAATFMTTLYGRYIHIMNRASAVESQLNAAFNLRQVLGLAVNVDMTQPYPGKGSIEGLAVTSPIGPLTSSGGLVVGASFDHIGDCGASNVSTVGAFLREAGGQGTAGSPITSNLVATGIYYMCPTATTSGVIFMDFGANPKNALTTVTTSPSYGKVYFDRVVQFDIVNASQGTSGPLTSVEISITVRSFFGTPQPSQMNWCPSADIANGTAGCTQAILKSPNMAAFTDFAESFQVTLGNQILGIDPSNTTTTSYQRVLGNTHFFPFTMPWNTSF